MPIKIIFYAYKKISLSLWKNTVPSKSQVSPIFQRTRMGGIREGRWCVVSMVMLAICTVCLCPAVEGIDGCLSWANVLLSGRIRYSFPSEARLLVAFLAMTMIKQVYSLSLCYWYKKRVPFFILPQQSMKVVYYI